MTESAEKYQSEILSRFECIEDWFADPDLGFKLLPMSGQFIRSVDFDECIFRIKAALPKDAKLMLYDGVAIRLGIMEDLYYMIFGSKEWSIVPEGEIIPKLEPIFLGKAFGDPVSDLRVIHVPEGIECQLVINKRTHTLSIPREEETDEHCIVIAKPKQ